MNDVYYILPGCTEGFLQIRTPNQTDVSACSHVNAVPGVSLDDCKTLAAQMGHNTINYHPAWMDCNIKHCYDGNLKVSSYYQAGFKIYTIYIFMLRKILGVQTR